MTSVLYRSVLFASLVALGAACALLGFAGCAETTEAEAYVPSYAEQFAVADYLEAQRACLELDASKATKESCVHDIRCAAGRVDASTCEENVTLLTCLADGGAYRCTGNTAASCTCVAWAGGDR